MVHFYAAFSPNLLEMQSLLSIPPEETDQATVTAADHFAQLLDERHPGNNTVIIVRAGPMGSYTLSKAWTGWVPAYWGEADQCKVVDVTGGGNAWMGGLCAGLLISGGDFKTGGFALLIFLKPASIYASTAASFAIQQRGLPRLTRLGSQELWNDDDPWERLQLMAQKADTTENTNHV